MDDCKLAVAVKFGTRVGSFSCAAAQRVDPKVEEDNYKYVKTMVSKAAINQSQKTRVHPNGIILKYQQSFG